MRQVLGPSGDEAQARRLARNSMRNYYKTLADFLRLPRLKVEEVNRLVYFDRWDIFDRALAPGKGVIFATFHMGSWDMGGAFLGLKGYPFSVLADVFQKTSLNQKVVKTRQEKGIFIIPAGRVPKAAVAALRKNHILGIIVDRPVASGVTVQLFGAPATVPAGAATLGLRTGACVLPGCLWRNDDGTVTCLVDEPIFPESTGRPKEDVQDLTQRIFTALEAMVRRDPGQWYMFRPMWPREGRDGRNADQGPRPAARLSTLDSLESGVPRTGARGQGPGRQLDPRPSTLDSPEGPC